MDKRVLIVGAITDFGGREIEVKLMTASFLARYRVSLLSTIPMTSKSFAIIKNSRFAWSTVDKIISKNILVSLVNLICKYRYSRSEPAYFFTKNKVNRLLIDFEKRYLQILEQEVRKHHYICYSGEFSCKWFNEIVFFANKHNKPILFRTTAELVEIPVHINPFLKMISKILVHSQANSRVLQANLLDNVKIIDQTTMQEQELLHIEIKRKTSNLVYGYLGRFSSEKGILNILEFFGSANQNLILAGSGTLQEEVNKRLQVSSNIQYLGELNNDEIHSFFKQIDVLIIPSVTEAGPLVGVEAMAAGKLIISTKVGAMEDRLVGTKNQFWFTPNDAGSLKEVIDIVESLSIEEVYDIQCQLRNIYLQKYAFEKLKKQYLDVFEGE